MKGSKKIMSAFFGTVFFNTVVVRVLIVAAIIAAVVLIARKWSRENADRFTEEERYRKEEELEAKRRSLR